MNPTEAAMAIVTRLNLAADARNRKKPETPPILATIQTDIPGIIGIDVDYPTESQAVRNKFLCRLQIDTTTGMMTFCPNGITNIENGEGYPLNKANDILHKMEKLIELH